MLKATFVELGNVELTEPAIYLLKKESVSSIFLLPSPSAIMKLIFSASYRDEDKGISLFSV